MRNRGRTRLTFQKRVDGNDGFGPIPGGGGWGGDIDIGVLLKPSRGVNERERNGVVDNNQIYEVEIRSHYLVNPGIDTTWRATNKATGATYNITTAAQNDADFRWTRLIIVAGAPI